MLMMSQWAIAAQEPFQRTQFVMVARSEVDRDVPEAQALVKPVQLQPRHVIPIVNATEEARAHRPVQLEEARA